MKFENTSVDGFEAAIRGARNPLNSWSKSDSIFGIMPDNYHLSAAIEKVASTYPNKKVNITGFDVYEFLNYNGILKQSNDGFASEVALIGHNDLSLLERLLDAGVSDSKFMRQINVSVDIVAPVFYLSELDTYKIGTTRNSTSIQHKGMSRDYVIDDFTIDNILLLPNNDDGNIVDSKADLQEIIDIVNKYRQLYKQTRDYKYFRVMRELMPMGYNYRITWSSNYAGLRNMYLQREHHRLSEWSKDFCSWCSSLPYGKDLIRYGTDMMPA